MWMQYPAYMLHMCISHRVLSWSRHALTQIYNSLQCNHTHQVFKISSKDDIDDNCVVHCIHFTDVDKAQCLTSGISMTTDGKTKTCYDRSVHRRTNSFCVAFDPLPLLIWVVFWCSRFLLPSKSMQRWTEESEWPLVNGCELLSVSVNP